MLDKNKKIKFYGLFYLTEDFQNLNFETSNRNLQINIYLKCAANLSKSLDYLGYEFVLLCNDSVAIKNIIKKNNIKLNISEIDFKTFVPKNIHFSSCHYRLDVFEFFSKQDNQLSVLIDLDVLVINKLPTLHEIFDNKVGYVNNIKDNIYPAYGENYIDLKLKTIKSSITERWVGGDFFAGDKEFFKLLFEISKFYQSEHVKNSDKLVNMTDELFLTAAINEIENKKLYKIKDINSLKLLSRYWSVNVKHKQQKFNYVINNYSLLHLPSDKIRLSSFYDKNLSIEDSKNDYKRYINSLNHRVFNLLSLYTPQFIKKIIKKLIY